MGWSRKAEVEIAPSVITPSAHGRGRLSRGGRGGSQMPIQRGTPLAEAYGRALAEGVENEFYQEWNNRRRRNRPEILEPGQRFPVSLLVSVLNYVVFK